MCSDLSDNQLRGRIRWNWAQLKGVDYIDISGNDLSGGLPESWYESEGLADIQTLCGPPLPPLFPNCTRYVKEI